MPGSVASRRSRTIAVALVGAVLAWLVLRNAAIGMAAAGLPAPAFAAGDPTVLIAASGYDRQAGSAPSANQTALLDRAARRDALYYQPLLAHAAALDARGDRTGAVRLAEVARSRDPRALAVRVFLLEHYLRQGRVDAAVAEMNPIAQLANGSAAPLMQMLSTLAQDPHGAEVVAKALKSNPAWRDAFIRQASGAGQALAFRTLATPPSSVADDTMRGNREAFLARLIVAGDYNRAYLAWINFLPEGQAEKVQAIYDGDFANLPGVAPFNWTLSSDETAVAQRVSDSSLPGRTALDVNYFGNDTAVIATETLLIPPGSYVFGLTGNGSTSGPFSGALRWQLTCLPSKTNIALARFTSFPGQSFTYSRRIAIPASGCDAQMLSLIGDAGEVSNLIQAQFTRLTLAAQ